MRTLGVIPARAGSKGVPGKNVRPLAGKPLLRYTAEAALRAKSLSRVILSTDSEEIAALGAACGLEVPFLRPPELAQDSSPTLPVLQHAVRTIEMTGDLYDAVCLLQPTTPFRTPDLIDRCVTMLAEADADAVMTVLQVPHQFNPHWVYFQQPDGSLRLSTGEGQPISRRQSLPPAFHREGSVYVVRKTVLMSSHSLYGSRTLGCPVSPQTSINIDSAEDWERAEQLVLRHQTEVSCL
jgi:CMP-N-acetylneuraminic acid synthetase